MIMCAHYGRVLTQARFDSAMCKLGPLLVTLCGAPEKL